eukprot:scaffold10185_cov66-Phaeocystis_antarctica.AAC.4
MPLRVPCRGEAGPAATACAPWIPKVPPCALGNVCRESTGLGFFSGCYIVHPTCRWQSVQPAGSPRAAQARCLGYRRVEPRPATA